MNHTIAIKTNPNKPRHIVKGDGMTLCGKPTGNYELITGTIDEVTCRTCLDYLNKGKFKDKNRKTDCPFDNFFGCTPVEKRNRCSSCIYNPDLDRNPEDKAHYDQMVQTNADIKAGRGILPGGVRTYFRYENPGKRRRDAPENDED